MAYQFEKSGKLKAPTDAELVAADAHSAIIMLNQGKTETGMPYWLYIAVKPSKYRAFKQAAAAKKSIHFKDYGTILKYGYDTYVPQNIKDEMKTKYGCDDNCMETAVQQVKNAKNQFLKQQEDKKIGDIVAMLKMKQLKK